MLSRSTPTTISPAGSISQSFTFLMFLLGWTAALATVLGFLGGVWWPLDVLADWRFILVAILAVAAVATGFGYSRISAMVFLVAAIVNALLIAPMWLEEQPTLTAGDRVRVISIDIGFAPDVRQRVIEWVHTAEGDVVVLANAGGTWEPAIEGLPYRIVNDDPGLTSGTVVLARNGIPVTVEEVPATLGAVDIAISVPLADRDVTFYAVSVERPVGANASAERLDAFAAINGTLRRTSAPTVVVGNLEASRWSHAFETISAELVNSEDGFGYMATYPSFDLPVVGEWFGIPVDHAIYTGPITVTHRRVGPNVGTDHRPLLVDFSPAGG